MQVVTIANQKGGVSKTTTAWALGAGLCKRGYSVLLVDLDAQTNLSFAVGADIGNQQTTLFEVFKDGAADINNAIIEVKPGLDLAVGSISFVNADSIFKGLYMLRSALESINKSYDYVVVDTPPTLGILTQNALAAADSVIIPSRADIYALQGIWQLNAFINERKTKIAGLLLTCFSERTTIARTMLEQFENVAKELNTKVYKTHIRNAVAVSESVMAQEDIFSYAPKATATQDYENFVKEFLKGAK